MEETQMDPISEGSVSVLTREDERTESEPGKFAHIVKRTPDKTAPALVTEALIFGNEVEALCGHRWVPSKDPKKLPVCPKCLEIHELYKQFNNDDRPLS